MRDLAAWKSFLEAAALMVWWIWRGGGKGAGLVADGWMDGRALGAAAISPTPPI